MSSREPKWDGWWDRHIEGVWQPFTGEEAFYLEKGYREKQSSITIGSRTMNYDTMKERDTVTSETNSIRRLDTRFGGFHWGRKKNLLQ
eukprot:m.47713 g.47713  ORF g.47713 m.47713 type:complete len:88 (+) comp10527_c0_seq3:214-477(+)